MIALVVAVATAVAGGIPVAFVAYTRIRRVDKPETESKTVVAQWAELRQLRADFQQCQEELTDCMKGKRLVELRNIDLEDLVAELQQGEPT